MTPLHRKLLRDLRRQTGQLVSIALLLGCGVMAFVGMRSTRQSVHAARMEYYARNRFPHVFASVRRAPEHVAERLRAIPGVGVVETRVVLPATMQVPRLPEMATAMLVSVPARRRAMLNELHIHQGRYVAADRDDEVMASVKFATMNALRPGETLDLVVNGRWKRVRIVGIASSPEYIYETGGAFFVDNRRFGILWMRREGVAAAGGMAGAFNNATALLSAGGSEAAVRDAMDRVLRPYGAVGAYGRDRQLSSEVLDGEMRQLDALAWVFPLFFLGIAAFLLNVVLTRLIATQRGEIGALKAFGYTDREVGAHYLGFAMIAVALGAVLGLLGAMWMGSAFTGIYADFFGFPSLVHRTDPATAAIGLAANGGAALFGALRAVRGAVRLPPAEAMRPPTPLRFRASIVERSWLGAALGPGARMVLRNLTRRPLRTAVSVLGIALASGVLIAGMYPFDGVERMMDVQFRRAQREHLTVSYQAPRSARAAHELQAIAGVARVEPFRAAAVRVRKGTAVRTTTILGVDGGGALRRLVDIAGRSYALPEGGLVLTLSLAEAMHIRSGDTVTVELPDRALTTRMVVVGRIEESIGTGGYMDRRALNALLREGDVADGAFLAVDPDREALVQARLARLPAVAGTTSRLAMLDYFDRTMAESTYISAGIVIFAAAIIAIGVIYNNARIAISERGRELASLRVLGFTRREVSALFLGEQSTITLGGLPFGALIGLGMAAILAAAFGSERHRFPLLIEPGTYIYSVGLILLVALGVAFAVRRRLDRLDLIGTLKTGE